MTFALTRVFVNGYNAIDKHGLFSFAWKLDTGCLKLHPLEITKYSS